MHAQRLMKTQVLAHKHRHTFYHTRSVPTPTHTATPLTTQVSIPAPTQIATLLTTQVSVPTP